MSSLELENENQGGLAVNSEWGCLLLSDVIRLWSKSRNAVCCSVCLGLLRHTSTRWLQFRWALYVSGELDAVRDARCLACCAVLMCRSAWVLRPLPAWVPPIRGWWAMLDYPTPSWLTMLGSRVPFSMQNSCGRQLERQ